MVVSYNYMEGKPSKYLLNESLGYLSTLFSRSILKRINQELFRNGYRVTSEQWFLLVYVWDRDGQSQKVLAERTYKDKTTVARLVAGIEKMGLIVRLPSRNDSREKIVYLTEKGRSVMDQATNIVQGLLDIAGEGIDEQEMKICKDVLRRAHRNLI